jgi:spermidine synthase
VPIEADIPARLAQIKISTRYVSAFFYGNLTNERIKYVNEAIDPTTPQNRDDSPRLIRLMFTQWFTKFDTSPVAFFAGLTLLGLIYLIFITKEEFVLFSTGAVVMGSEIIIIFVFQIFFGYIYFQIGLIVTVFLAGLMPGAFLGDRFCGQGIKLIGITDGLLVILMGALVSVIWQGGDQLPVSVYLAFGFAVSLVCGFQFPVALALRGGGNSAVTRTFSADLIGAAAGILFTSVVLIPYFGIIWAVAGLIALKIISLMVVLIRDRLKTLPFDRFRRQT